MIAPLRASMLLLVSGIACPFSVVPAIANEPLLHPGVRISVRLGGVPAEDAQQVSGDYTLSSSGDLNLLHLKKEIKASGLRATELAKVIMSTYKSEDIYLNPNIVVLVTGSAISDHVVTVGGEVRQPRTVPYRPGLDLYGAITEAGGPSEFASMRYVKLVRGKQETVVDMRKITPENSVELRAGDKVVVP